MKCEDIQTDLMDYVDRPEQVSSDVREHVKNCPDCRGDVSFFQQMNRLFERDRESLTTPEKPRADARESIREKLTSSPGFKQLILAFLAGLGMAWMAVQSLPVVESAGWVASCGLWWGGLFVMGTTLMVGGVKLSNGRTSAVAGISTVSAGLVFAGLYLCPGVQGMTGLAEITGLQSLFHTVTGPPVAYALVGLLYALVPTALVSVFWAERIPDHRGRASLLAGLGFLLLMAPMVYVECSLLPPLGATLLVLGMVVGSMGGPLSGLLLRSIVSPRVI